MVYYAVSTTICLLALGFLYYFKCRKMKATDDKLELMITKYVELMETLHSTQKDYNNLSDKYRYKLSLIVVLQDKLSEVGKVAEELQKKYNLLYQAYLENKDNLKFAEAILSGTPEEI